MLRSIVMRSTAWVAVFSKASCPLLASIMAHSGWTCVIKARIIMRDSRESSTMSTVGTSDIEPSLVMMHVVQRMSLLETIHTPPPHNSLPRGRSGPGTGCLKKFHVPRMHRCLGHGLMVLCLSLFPSVRQGGSEGQEWHMVVGLGGLRESRTQAPQGAEGLLGIVQELADDVFKLQG